ncbi:MAG: hypothetical protein JWM76_4394 [Pseudonocardiales bacterium]|nr:hypothetical protein [Pseudonocardiales bacterium]
MIVNLVRSEIRKLTSTQVWFWMFLLALGLTALFVIVPLAGDSQLDLQDHVQDVFLAPVTAYVGSFVLGVLGVTTEYRYQTITPTLLATPSRWTLMTAKMISYLIIGAIYAGTCAIVSVVVAWPWLSAKGVTVSFGSQHLAGAIFEVFAAVVLFGLLGLGWGALVRNQIVAVSIGVIWVLLAERLIFSIPGIRVLRPYLPTGGLDAITSPHENLPGGVSLFGSAAGMAVILVWGFAFAIGGAAYSMNRDIT